MSYTVGEAARRLNVAPSTLRYYDKEGLLPAVSRTEGGIRMFTAADMETLSMIGCLKKAGMSIKDIKQFMDSSLKRLGLGRQWLDKILSENSVDPTDIFMMTAETAAKYRIIKKELSTECRGDNIIEKG